MRPFLLQTMQLSVVVLASAGRQVIAPKDTCCTTSLNGQRPQLRATVVLQAATMLLHANMVYKVC